MRIHYLDPALAIRAGHHLEWARRIAAALHAAGHEVQAFVHQGAGDDVRAALHGHAAITPLFATSPYLDRAVLDPVAGELAHYTASVLELPARLAGLPPADLWLWPTLTAEHLVAMGLARVTTPVAACIHFAPQAHSALGPQAWRYGAQLARLAGVPLRLGLTVPELVPLYEPLLGQVLPELPLLVEAAPLAPVSTPPRTVGFFGDQQSRKGPALLDGLVTGLVRAGWQVVVQDAGGRLQVTGATPANLRLLGYVPDIPAAMAGCDLIVAPYQPDAYRTMGSGIVWDAVSRGIPVVAPAGTSPGRWVTELGAGVTFERHDVPGVLQAVERARVEHARIAAGARSAALSWGERHGVRRFLAAMMAAPVSMGGKSAAT